MNDFLYEGGYAFYVWTSYGVSALAMIGLIGWAVAGWRKAKARLMALASGEEETS